MKRHPAQRFWYACGLLLLLVLAFGPVWPWTTHYKSVNDRADGFAGDLLRTDGYFPTGHLVRNGKLYLPRYQRSSGAILATYVADKEWDAKSIAEFRRRYPQLETYWPDATRPDGGVGWLQPSH